MSNRRFALARRLDILEHFPLATAAVLLPALTTLAGAWLHARYGGKVRLKFGSGGTVEEVEAQTIKQLHEALLLADEYQQYNGLMTKPSCVKCGNADFERQYAVVSGVGVWFVNCSSCGGVVGVLDQATKGHN